MQKKKHRKVEQKKAKKGGKVGKIIKKYKKIKYECTVDYCCNPQWFWVCGNNNFPTPFSVIKKNLAEKYCNNQQCFKEKNYKTKFLISSILKKIDKYNFEKFKNKIEKLCGKTPLQSTVF